MRAIDVIQEKRDGHAHSADVIHSFIAAYTAGQVPDYQVSAWLMAVYFRGMTPRETADLTMALAQSGELLDLARYGAHSADKHSTGGVGDKTSLVAAPLAAAAGAKVAKMSGRGLSHTGGTIDKLESIAGFRTSLTREEFDRQVDEVGLVVAGQSGDLAPADKLLYALRDVTATVDSLPLIAASIMSKKLASGAHNIVLDVKTGSGAFMKTPEQAVALAQAMVDIGEHARRRVVALISDMEQPLGYAVGNALEVEEAVRTLRGAGPEDLTDIAVALATEMVAQTHDRRGLDAARQAVLDALHSGAGLRKLRAMVIAQGGQWDDPDGMPKLPEASSVHGVWRAPADGWVRGIDALAVGRAAALSGAGRERKDEAVDPRAGVLLHRRVGDACGAGEALATVYASDDERLRGALAQLGGAFTLGGRVARKKQIILARVDHAGIVWSDSHHS